MTNDTIPFGDEETKYIREGDESTPPVYLAPDTSHETCPDCGVERGEVHRPGCDNEQCPVCGLQLIGCGHYETVRDDAE